LQYRQRVKGRISGVSDFRALTYKFHSFTPPNLSDEVIAVCGYDDVLQIPSLSNHLGIWSIRLQTCLGYRDRSVTRKLALQMSHALVEQKPVGLHGC
jgi:hypothetical protein